MQRGSLNQLDAQGRRSLLGDERVLSFAQNISWANKTGLSEEASLAIGPCPWLAMAEMSPRIDSPATFSFLVVRASSAIEAFSRWRRCQWRKVWRYFLICRVDARWLFG